MLWARWRRSRVQPVCFQDWLYEVKFDGYRCLAGSRSHGVTLWSRRGNLFTAQFLDITVACERLPADTLLDGEIVAIDESGRISFNLLQHHRSIAQVPGSQRLSRRFTGWLSVGYCKAARRAPTRVIELSAAPGLNLKKLSRFTDTPVFDIYLAYDC
jgi:ATP dependent DNA ligase domain